MALWTPIRGDWNRVEGTARNGRAVTLNMPGSPYPSRQQP